MKYYLSLVFLKLPRLCIKLQTGLWRPVGLYRQLFWYLLRSRTTAGAVEATIECRYAGSAFSLTLFDGGPDVAALIETFVDQEYRYEPIDNPKVIFDLGAHNGNTAIFFALLYPQATVYAVEASPNNFAKLQQNAATWTNIVPIQAAVGGESGEVSFFESKSTIGSSLQRRSPDDVEVRVPMLTLPDLLATQALTYADVIKADIEGGEAHLFNGQQPEAFARCYMIEVHEDLMIDSRETFNAQFNAFTLSVRPIKSCRYLLYAIKQ